MRWSLIVAACLLLAFAAGCGDDEESSEAGAARELVDRLPEGEFAGIVVVDLAAAREQLGLPDDADPVELFDSEDADERLFAFHTSIGLEHLVTPIDDPVREAIDHGRVTAYTGHTYSGEEAVTLLATEQPFEEIAAELEDAGYERDGDAVADDEPQVRHAYEALAPAEDGVIVLGQTAAAVEAAASGEVEPGTGPGRELLDAVDAPLAASADGPAESCVLALAVGEDLATGEGELVIELDADADPAAFVGGESGVFGFAGLELGEPAADGGRLTVPISAPAGPRAATANPLSILFGDASVADLYEC